MCLRMAQAEDTRYKWQIILWVKNDFQSPENIRKLVAANSSQQTDFENHDLLMGWTGYRKQVGDNLRVPRDVNV